MAKKYPQKFVVFEHLTITTDGKCICQYITYYDNCEKAYSVKMTNFCVTDKNAPIRTSN